MRRVHLACGDVYLEGYENVDIYGDVIGVIKENNNLTTLDKYYKYPFGTPSRRPIVDYHLDLFTEQWPYEQFGVDEFLMISAVEHFSKKDFTSTIVTRIHYSLVPGGKFIFDFPDIEETIKQYANDFEMIMRLIYGSHKNKWCVHRWGYNKETIISALGDVPVLSKKWEKIEFKNIIKHDYPMIGCIATK